MKQTIKTAIETFDPDNFYLSSLNFFNVLGYRSQRTMLLDDPTFEGFWEQFDKSIDEIDTDKIKREDWKEIQFLFQLTNDEIIDTEQISLLNSKIVDTESESYLNSYLFIALALKKDEYTKTELVTITRHINKQFKQPALILFYYDKKLCLSIIDRRMHKRAQHKDVLEKVTLIKDIRIDKPHRAHVEILNDLALYNLIAHTFVQLHKEFRRVLDTKLLNKKFYMEIANWYFRALKVCKYPDEIQEPHMLEISLIRFISRMLFSWFMKEKGLIPPEIFTENFYNSELHHIDPEQSTYYKAVLQNLFFATLNCRIDDRDYLQETKGFLNPQHTVYTKFRYKDYIKNPGKFIEIFSKTPFLNGGLFECLDTLNDNNQKVCVDCFTNNTTNRKKLTFPDELFFTSATLDFSEVYDDKRKDHVHVYSLFDILNQYKFTIEENTPVEQEIALDPELLGQVLENLLASYNPETKATARKSTGSYYTPREIVNYMVDESLIAYLEQYLKDHDDNLKEMDSLDELLRDTFAYTEENHPFDEHEVEIIVDAILNLKMLDPACGSGAFPMGVLLKMVYVLERIDPDNRIWKERLFRMVPDELKSHIIVHTDNFTRKLGLIWNSIYGVDIQPIAVQLSKLRFFISLIVEQKVDWNNPDNFGIIPLPNLETKFVAANTLIGIKRPEQTKSGENQRIEKEKEIKDNRLKYFNADTRNKKLELRNKDRELRKELSQILKRLGYPDDTSEKIVQWDPFNVNHYSEWFDPEYMFMVSDGFDVVLGNPPYGLLNKRQNRSFGHIASPEQLDYYRNYPKYKYAKGGIINVFRLFILKSIELLKRNGIFSEIFPLAFVGDISSNKLRKYLLENYTLLSIEAFPERDNEKKRVFEAVKMSVCILNLRKEKDRNNFFIRINNNKFIDMRNDRVLLSYDKIKTLDKKYYTIPLINDQDLHILLKIFRKSDRIDDIGHCFTGEIDLTQDRKYITDISKNSVLIKGAIVDKYCIRNNMSQGRIEYLNSEYYLRKVNSKRSFHHNYERIVMQAITGVNEKCRLRMTIINKDTYCANSVNYVILKTRKYCNKFILGILNSKISNFVFSKNSTNSNVNGYEVDNLPIPRANKNIQEIINRIVKQILTDKNNGKDTTSYENQIDIIAYKLFDLTYQEAKIVDPEFDNVLAEFGLSKEDYEKMGVEGLGNLT